MSEKKADHRLAFSQERNAVIVELCRARRIAVKDWMEALINDEVDRVVHESTVVTQAAVRSGLVRFEAASGGLTRTSAVRVVGK
jgi:hypothetical protein